MAHLETTRWLQSDLNPKENRVNKYLLKLKIQTYQELALPRVFSAPLVGHVGRHVIIRVNNAW